jgi:hypothetical protein
LDEDSKMKEIDEEGSWSDENMREDWGVDFPQISRLQTIFGYQLGLFKFPGDQSDGAISIKLGTAEFEISARGISRQSPGEIEELSGGFFVWGIAGARIGRNFGTS